MAMGTGALNRKTVKPASTYFQHIFISVEDKVTGDVSTFFIPKLIRPFETHWFSFSSLLAKVTIYKRTILSPGWDLRIACLCSLFEWIM
jgi:hypothetical protein